MNNPIIQREFIGMLRTRRALALQVALVAALAALVLVRWPSEATVDLSGAEAQQVLRVFGYGLMTVLILLAPVFPATSIVKERVQGTLALLLNSPIHPWSIVVGKLTGVVGFIALLMVLSLPAAAACLAMGGVDRGQLAMLYLVLFMLALMYATLGLLISSYARSTDAALRLTYGSVLVLAIITLGPHAFLAEQIWVSPTLYLVVDWMRSLSPLPAVMQLLGDTGVGAGGQMEQANLGLRFVLVSAVFSAVFATWTATRMNQRLFDSPRDQGTVTDEQSARVKAYRRIMYLWFFDPNRRSGLIGPLTNPVMVKEQRCRKFGRGHWMMRLIGACLIISLGLMLVAAWQATDVDLGRLGGIMVLLQVALIVLVTPALASGLISGERESRGWQLLQMTPMSPVTIVLGKLMSVAVTLVLILGATLPGYAVLIAIQPAQQATVINVLISLSLTAVMALLLSAAVSSVVRQTAAATATSYTILLTLCAGTLLIWLAQDAPFTPQTVEAVLSVNPLAAALSLIDTPGFTRYNLVPINWWITGGLAAASLALLVVRVWRLTRPQ
jgi:ABC-type transport system involved in multi-copper enzyme maturation permease subunit